MMNFSEVGDILIIVNLALCASGIFIEAKLSVCDKRYRTPFLKYRIERIGLLALSMAIFIYSIFTSTIPDFNPMRLAYFCLLAYINIRGVYELIAR